jgi:hypothetical protein
MMITFGRPYDAPATYFKPFALAALLLCAVFSVLLRQADSSPGLLVLSLSTLLMVLASVTGGIMVLMTVRLKINKFLLIGALFYLLTIFIPTWLIAPENFPVGQMGLAISILAADLLLPVFVVGLHSLFRWAKFRD